MKFWQDKPDFSEGKNILYSIKNINISTLKNVGWATNSIKDNLKRAMISKEKLPLILVEYKNGEYCLHDGQHRLAAYKELFPNKKKIMAAVYNT